MERFVAFKMTAVQRFGMAGTWSYDQWKRLNEAFFDNGCMVGEIIWEKIMPPKRLGYYAPHSNRIGLSRHLMRPRYPAANILSWEFRHLNRKLAADILLHEMIHQNIHQTGGWHGENSHNNDRFVHEVNRIAKCMGLPVRAKVIGKADAHGQIRPTDLAYLSAAALYDFPYSLRNAGYYASSGTFPRDRCWRGE